ncbi:hypothetical protein AMS68_001798 [Peltaster fructicola]|uniref:Aminoglycoside phosphotransferase domain-containing protein n=1 Tax=Peltaster fructicola TaxID=286661 RepID=A0A6H0XNQ1_9PEZI|nr:hypothetical protein AMS68_001798 [Peltaster fructicola]
MSLMPGVVYNVLQQRQRGVTSESIKKLERLIEGLADVFARSWHLSELSISANGRIGRSLRSRLLKLSVDLPDSGLRRLARQAILAVDNGMLEQLPLVLTHGDLLPSNLVVDETTGELTGVIDWAEAEYLPFGLALYGLDHLLGVMSTSGQFVYYTQSELLRQLFWTRLIREVAALADARVLRAVMLARTVGVLLWHGYAWDDGKIERVVDAQRDAGELAYLRAFLQADSKPLL